MVLHLSDGRLCDGHNRIFGITSQLEEASKANLSRHLSADISQLQNFHTFFIISFHTTHTKSEMIFSLNLFHITSHNIRLASIFI